MVKNILLIVMTILAVVFFVFGYIQKKEADTKTELAIALKKEVEQAQIKADRAAAAAEAARMEADHQRLLAMQCEASKKK